MRLGFATIHITVHFTFLSVFFSFDQRFQLTQHFSAALPATAQLLKRFFHAFSRPDLFHQASAAARAQRFERADHQRAFLLWHITDQTGRRQRMRSDAARHLSQVTGAARRHQVKQKIDKGLSFLHRALFQISLEGAGKYTAGQRGALRCFKRRTVQMPQKSVVLKNAQSIALHHRAVFGAIQQ